MKSNIRDFAKTEGTSTPTLELDALVVGAGFSGIYCLHEMRKLGLRTAIFEAGPDIGGTWRWNCYPGARVDSEVPEYQLSIPETWADWTWSTNYPAYGEIRAYFDHVASVLDIRKDCHFSTVVVKADFNPETARWTVTTQDGRQATAKYFIIGSGFAAKRYIPAWPGIESYRGTIHHSSFWPEDGVDVRGKRCAVVGTGASGVQVTQAWGPTAGSLTLFQRTPNLALPMRRRPLSAEEQNQIKPVYPQLFSLREKTFAGFLYDFSERGVFEDSEEERESFLEHLWEGGGFRYWLSNYKDLFFEAKANRVLYDFWATKVRARIQDPVKRDILAPEEPFHAFGIKRPSLEVDYYEQFNRPNVQVVNTRGNPIVSFTETGLKLKDGTQHDFDVICVATGFDVSTGGLMDMGLQSVHGKSLKEEWAPAVHTYLGMTISGYPNLFYTYGPHGPTQLCNGPTGLEIQVRWVVDAIKHMEQKGIKTIDPTPTAAHAWKHRIDHLSNLTLLPSTQSTYMGGGQPGKPVEQLNYAGGIPSYLDEVRKVLPDFQGFSVVMDGEN